jgi:hypothetical protein
MLSKVWRIPARVRTERRQPQTDGLNEALELALEGLARREAYETTVAMLWVGYLTFIVFVAALMNSANDGW